MTTPKRSYESGLAATARQDFAKHGLRSSAPGSWAIGRLEGGSIYYARILRPDASTIIVYGDVEIAAFRGGDGKEWDDRAHLGWLAHSDLRYAAEKASIGMGERRCAWGLDHDAAKAQLAEMIQEKWHEWLSEAIDMLRRGDELEDVRRWLFGETSDAELCSGLGEVVAPRVIYAHAAVVRLCELLDARTP